MSILHPGSRVFRRLCHWAAVLLVVLVLCGGGASEAWAQRGKKKPVVEEVKKPSYILAYSLVFFVFALGTFVAIRPGSRAAEG
jgi:hypothetical protein